MDPQNSPLVGSPNRDIYSDRGRNKVYAEFHYAFPSPDGENSIHLNAAPGDHWRLPVPDPLYCQNAAQTAEKSLVAKKP